MLSTMDLELSFALAIIGIPVSFILSLLFYVLLTYLQSR